MIILAETVLENAKPEDTGFSDFLTPFNLLVCYYAVGDSNKIKRTFTFNIGTIARIHADEDEEEEKSREEGYS